MKPFFAVVQFLTRVPVPASWAGDVPELARSIAYFPIVGILIGAGVAVLDHLLGRLLPLFPASVLVVIALLAVSGCLHLDGLADTADGFLSSRPRERILEIMKDSRTGPMGVIAVVSVIALKIALISSVAGPFRWRTILLTPIAGRCALLIVMALLPYARSEGGLGSLFFENRSRLHAVWALVVLASVGWLVAGTMGLIVGLASFAASLLFAVYTYGKIGGATGDTLGAACEIVELVPALIAAAWIHLGMQI